MPLYIGEDLAAHTNVTPTLRVHASGLVKGHALEIEVNGKGLGNAKFAEALGDNAQEAWLEFVPDATVFQKGENLVTARIRNAMGGPPKITQVRLKVAGN